MRKIQINVNLAGIKQHSVGIGCSRSGDSHGLAGVNILCEILIQNIRPSTDVCPGCLILISGERIN